MNGMSVSIRQEVRRLDAKLEQIVVYCYIRMNNGG